MLSVVSEGCRRCKILWADRDGAESDVAPVPSKPAVKHHTYTSLEGLNFSCRNRSVVIVIVRNYFQLQKLFQIGYWSPCG